jgi:hypothetical protein
MAMVRNSGSGIKSTLHADAVAAFCLELIPFFGAAKDFDNNEEFDFDKLTDEVNGWLAKIGEVAALKALCWYLEATGVQFKSTLSPQLREFASDFENGRCDFSHPRGRDLDAIALSISKWNPSDLPDKSMQRISEAVTQELIVKYAMESDNEFKVQRCDRFPF